MNFIYSIVLCCLVVRCSFMSLQSCQIVDYCCQNASCCILSPALSLQLQSVASSCLLLPEIFSLALPVAICCQQLPTVAGCHCRWRSLSLEVSGPALLVATCCQQLPIVADIARRLTPKGIISGCPAGYHSSVNNAIVCAF